MLASLLVGVVVLAQPNASAQTQLEVRVAPTGSLQEVRLAGEVVAADLGLMIVKPGWNGMWVDQRHADAAGLRVTMRGGTTRVQGRMAVEGGEVELTETVEPGPRGVRLRYAVKPSVQLAAEGVFVSVLLPAQLVARAGKWYAFDGVSFRTAAFPEKLPDQYHLVGGPMNWIGWTLPSGAGMRFDLAQSTPKSVNLQDDRKFDMQYFELHLPVPDTAALRAGETVQCELLLRPLTAQAAQEEEAAALAAQGAETVTFESAKPLRIGDLVPPRKPLAQFGRLELTLDLDATYDNPFDPEQIDVEATFACPEGRKLSVPGFFYVPYERREVNGQEVLRRTGDPIWKVRFAPMVSGRYECVVSATDGSGTAQTKPMRFQVKPSQRPGFVRRSEKSPYYLRLDSGKPYFAVGENVCWAGGRQTLDYDRWFPALSNSGGNYARLWLVRWNMGLEWTPDDPGARGRFYGLGRYSPDNAWRLDYVMDLAEKDGIYVMLCLGYHGELLDTPGYFGEDCWARNPYNKASGGPCDTPADFWTNPTAREHYRHRLRYYIARWGCCPSVLSFEFWNEVVAPAPWLQEMAAYLRDSDPYQHLITTTYGYDEVWRLPQIGYTQSHTYGVQDQRRDCVDEIARLCRTHTEQFSKPHLVGEFGIDWQTSDAQHDPAGHGTNLHNGLWAAMASRSMGGAMVWYWDGYVEPLDLYHEFTALGRFARDVPWSELNFALADISPPTREPVPGEQWRDLEVSPGMGWGKATGSDFAIEPDGRLTGEGTFSSFLYAPSKPNERTPLRFRVTCPQGGRLSFHIGTVSVAARLQVLVDGRVAWEKEFKAGPPGEGEYQQTKWVEQFKMWQSTYDAQYTVDLPPGEHTVELRNEGSDWIEVDRYRFTGCVDPRFATDLDVLGLETTDFAILWLHNRASNWYNRSHNLPVEPIRSATFALRGLSDGRYAVEWYDTATGTCARRQRASCREGKLPLSPAPILADVACKIRRMR